MKNVSGTIGGFVIGMGGFLLLFKLIILDHTPPSDELAPGIVMLASIMSGIFFSMVGQWMQQYFGKNKSTMESK